VLLKALKQFPAHVGPLADGAGTENAKTPGSGGSMRALFS
jgi:hypothetical protein